MTVFNGRSQLTAKEKLEVTDAQRNSQALSAPHIILATGAKARHVPQLAVDGKYVWSYKEALVPEQYRKVFGCRFRCNW